jgi:hypothetical protein
VSFFGPAPRIVPSLVCLVVTSATGVVVGLELVVAGVDVVAPGALALLLLQRAAQGDAPHVARRRQARVLEGAGQPPKALPDSPAGWKHGLW